MFFETDQLDSLIIWNTIQDAPREAPINVQNLNLQTISHRSQQTLSWIVNRSKHGYISRHDRAESVPVGVEQSCHVFELAD